MHSNLIVFCAYAKKATNDSLESNQAQIVNIDTIKCLLKQPNTKCDSFD